MIEPGTSVGPKREVAFVTGAGSGIGAAVAERLAARGARLGLFDRSTEAVERIAEQVSASGAETVALIGDVSDDGAVEIGIAQTETAFGPLTTAVAAAGVEVQGTILDIDFDDWKRSLSVNLSGVFSVARHAVPRLI